MLRVRVDVVAARLDEAALSAGLEPLEAVASLARAKAEAVDGNGRPVLAADTIVVLDDDVLGKPTDRSEAAAMLARQSGETVQVISAVALKLADGSMDERIAIATLGIAKLTEAVIAEYLATGEADDKAGALAVQGAASKFVTIVQGARSTVVGLPLAETIELLRNAGIAVEEPTGAPL